MGKSQRKRKPDFAYVTKSFLGYLEGTEKSLHTIKNYRSDLVTFQKFLEKGLGSQPVAITKLTLHDLERYNDYLKILKLKTNSRRRKLLTIRKLLRYLSQRKQIGIDVGQKLPAPAKMERIPLTVSQPELLQKIRSMPSVSEIEARNRVLLWTLAETGCQVSEATQIRFEQWEAQSGGKSALHISGKMPRAVPVSCELYEEVQKLQILTQTKKPSPWIFLGFNKFGSLGSPITSRGVELLVKAYAERLEIEGLTPRTFRHSAVVQWFKEGLEQDEIQRRLGLRTAYAFRTYDLLRPKEDGKAGTQAAAE